MKDRKYLSVAVLERIMSEKQLGQIKVLYDMNTGSRNRYKDRSESLGSPIEDEDIKMLNRYLSDTDIPVSELAKEAGIPYHQYVDRVHRTALKTLYQD